MKIVKDFIKSFAFILLLGLCITMLSKGEGVFAAGDNAKLNVTNVSIIKDGTYKLKVYNLSDSQSVIYRSNDTSVATVSSSGKIKGLSLGTAIITATVVEGDTPVATLQCDVLIGPAAISIKFTKSEVVLQVGGMKLLNTIISPLNTVEEPVFYSTDSSKVTVSSLGRARAKETGVVQVYAFLSNGQTACANVIVLNEEYYQQFVDGRSVDEIIAEMEEAEAAAKAEEAQNTESRNESSATTDNAVSGQTSSEKAPLSE